MNKKQLDLTINVILKLREEFHSDIQLKQHRKFISEKTGISETNLCNYAKGTKSISDKKIIEIYKKIL